MNRGIFLSLLLVPLLSLWPETYSFSGDKSFSVMRKGEEVTTIEGHVEIYSENKDIFAGMVSIKGSENPEFDGSGSVRIFDRQEEWELKAEEFNFAPQKKLLRARGDVRLEDRRNNLFIRCQVISVYEEKNQILMEVGVRLFKDDIVCRSQYALYRRDGNILELTGFPVVYKGEDLYRADRITVNLDTNEITMTGRIEGSLITSQEESRD
jgi:lipopolysaccharide export system protein LptA